MICHSPSSLSNIQSHTLTLLRLFAGVPAQWVVGLIDTDKQAQSNADIPGSGIIVYENGIRTILNSRSETSSFAWSLEFIGETGRIISRNAHAQFEIWTPHPENRCPYPDTPSRPLASQKLNG